jgi:Flp pilus assembly protein TadG
MDRRGNVSVMFALLLIPLMGMFALGGEVASWMTTQRALQNAADSAAIAAGTSGDTTVVNGQPAYYWEAQGVAAKYNLGDNVTIGAVSTTASPCPSGETCYQVTVSRVVPLLLVGVVGYSGTTTLNGANAQTITARAMARGATGAASLCILALGGDITSGITANGTPKSNLNTCSVASNGDTSCNGANSLQNAGNGYGYDSDTCGSNLFSGCASYNGCAAKFSDNLDLNRMTSAARSADLAKCGGSFPQEGSAGFKTVSAITLSSSGDTVFCGDVQLGTDIIVNGPGTIVIENGQLDMNGHNLSATGVTLVFSGTTSSTSNHLVDDNSHPGNKSTLTLTAPSSGTYAGVAMYQDPNLTSGVDWSNAGSGPNWEIEGLAYLPHSNVTISGSIDGSDTENCVGLVVNTLNFNGGGYFANYTGCKNSGTVLPTAPFARTTLVQ